MKHQVANTIKALVMMVSLMGSFQALGAKPCPNEIVFNDNILDLRAIHPKQESFYDELDETKENAKYDLRRKIDRQNINQNDPMYALNAIGKVTTGAVKEGQPGFFEATKNEENTSWGTGFMISPCHMITNHHVVCEKETVNGVKACRSDGSVKKNVNFSFGENSNGTDFKGRVTGNVAEFDSDFDFAIVRMESLKDQDVPYITPNFWDISKINEVVSLGAGYPVQSLGQNSHKLYGMKAILSENSAYVNGKMSFTPGNSGSPTMNLKNSTLTASGIYSKGGHDSSGNAKLNGSPKITSMPTIGAALKQKNPALLKEILNSLRTGKCQ